MLCVRFTKISMKYALLFFFFLFLQSCANISHLDSEPERMELLDQCLAEQEFSKALALIADTPKEHLQAQELEEKRKLILDQLQSFEKQTISTALTQEKNNDWPGARLTYKEALKKNSTSIPLKEAQQAMIERFHGKMATLDHELLIINGEFLLKELPLLQERHESDPEDMIVKWRYSRTQNDIREIGIELLRVGEQKFADNDLAMARRTLPLAAKLAPKDPEAQAALRLLNSRLKASKIKKQKTRKKVAKKNDKIEIEAFDKAMANGDLSGARHHLGRLTPVMQRSVVAELMHERLDSAIEQYVQEEQSRGDFFYRVGDYQQAIKAWENVIELDPDNEAVKTKLERAATIVEKLESLRERQK